MIISLFLATLRLAAPFSDGAVLQRGMPVPVWGTAEPNARVTVAFAGQEKAATAMADGSWRVTLDPLETSCDGRELTVAEQPSGQQVPNRTVLQDVVVGEVWYVSGQSNAECPLWGESPRFRDRNGALTAQMTDKPLVRMCYASNYRSSPTPRKFPAYEARWQKFSRTSLGTGHSFSAVGTYFALGLHAALGVPVGVVGSYFGGTCIEPWIPAEGYASVGLDPRACVELTACHQRPCVLWNEMVSPWTPMAMRGVVWYQGCSNRNHPERYCQRMHALYNGWAKTFENPDLKIYFVQIAPWAIGGNPEFQQAQAQFDAEEPNAGMAVINDLGNLTDIHPNEKYTVAKRLLVHALKRDYGFPDIRDNSPTLRDWRIEKGRFVLSFDDADGFYIYNQKYCSRETGFELCGADGVWKPALVANQKVTVRANGDRVYLGQVEGRELVVEAAGVPEPKRLRYLYSRPWYGSLYNEVGLPLGSFAIDGHRSDVLTGKSGIEACA